MRKKSLNRFWWAGWMAMILLMFSLQAFTQPRTVTGKVTAGDTGDPLPGANIVIKGTAQGVISDLDGNYEIGIQSPEDILVFRFIGYVDQAVQVGDLSVIDVVLEVETVGLEEIVVIGYGKVKKSDLTGSVSSVKSEDIVKITSANVEQGLQGKVAGVQVTSTSGAPGAVPSVRVRGVGTFNNSSPIFVVDGVILDNISFLNSADIESMEVLKDASATAIYGSRGANGVIIITTKSGAEGLAKPQFSFSSEVGLQRVARQIDLLDGREFAIISNEIKPGSYNNIDAVPNTDWQSLIFSMAPIQNHQLSVSGAGDIARYYMGIGYFGQDGIIDKSFYKRLSLKLNNVYQLSEQFRLGNNITIAPYNQRNAPNVTYSVYRAQPVLEPYYSDGSYAVVYNVGNPLADLAHSNNFNNGVRGVGNVYAEASFLHSFTLKSSFGVDAAYNKSESFTPAYTIYNPDGTASQQDNTFSDLYKGTSDNLTWLWENTISFDKIFDKHYINAVAGYTMQKTTSEQYGLSGANILRDNPEFWYINPSYIYDPSSNIDLVQNINNSVDPGQYYSMISYLFRANYTYSDKYIFTATFRRDGSSKFSEDNRFANFPSFAAGWNIGREAFIEDVPHVSSLKLRASWGIIGNDKITYFDRYARVQSDIITVFGFPDNAFPAASYGKSGNPDLKWESTKQTDIGLEFGLLENRLTGELDYYNRMTDDILVELSTPGHMGNGLGQRIRYNAASVSNSGIEFLLNWREKRGDFNYSVGILGSTIHNEVKSIGGASGIDSTLIGGYLGNGQPVTLSRVGLPIGAFYGYVTDGIFQNTEELGACPHLSQAGVGDLRFVDTNDDGVLNGEDRTFIGSPIPDFIFGINFSAAYRGFDLAVDFHGQAGNEIFNGKEVVRPDPYNFEQHVMERWTGENTSDTEPRPSFGGYNYLPSDRFIQNGSFLRLRTLSLGYTLPESLSERWHIARARIYLKGNNIFTLTRFTGYTPEIGSNDVLSNGIDNGIYPITAIYSVGLNLTF
ncbi:MAG: TonB-dependent receptor [Bacteroidales bacterium]|nr:TonB-dependent receptor [Bacteroidales bacterium]